MRIHYEFLQEELYAGEKPYTAYGILIRDMDTGTVIYKINDISLNRNEVHKLVELCNTHSMSPEHLQDIVQDFLSV